MAEAALSKSLDDIIAEQRTKKEKQQSRRGSKPEKAAEGSRPPRDAGRAPRPRGRGNLRVTVGAHVSKPVPRIGGGSGRGGVRGGGAGRPAPRVIDVQKQDPQLRLAALEGGAKWGHDLYDRSEGGRRRADPRQPSALGTKLFVSNLHWEVTPEDVKELFQTVAPVLSHAVHFDNSGRSEGTAEVVFKTRAQAVLAQNQYSGVKLDNREIQIDLIEQATGTAPRTLRSGVTVSGGGGGRTAASPRIVILTRQFEQATAGARSRPRGRGTVRGHDSMQE